jgi:hypothetical protein
VNRASGFLAGGIAHSAADDRLLLAIGYRWIAFTSRNSSRPLRPSSRPLPDCLFPKGAKEK